MVGATNKTVARFRPSMATLVALVAVVLLAACGGSDEPTVITVPDDPTDLVTEWPSVCDEAFALAERVGQEGSDSQAVASGLAAAAAPLFTECTQLVVAEYPESCLGVVAASSGLIEAAIEDSDAGGTGAGELALRRANALVECDIDHVYDVVTPS